MYAQRGHGKRSSFYSDYTFGAWNTTTAGPVGKAYSGFTDEELRPARQMGARQHDNRFGPVREVAPGLVLEVAFDSVHRSTRHKSGVAMRFPRVHRIRWDKPAGKPTGWKRSRSDRGVGTLILPSRTRRVPPSPACTGEGF